MSWSKDSSIRPGDDQNKVRLKTHSSENGLTNLEQQQVGGIVSDAREALPQVMGMLSWPNSTNKAKLNPLLQRYFLTTGDWPDANTINTMLANLELVMNGINTKVNVKVAHDDDALGYVGFRTGFKGVLRGMFSSRHNLGTRNGETVSRGDIHLKRSRLDKHDLMIITFIHEASHKYASTADHGNSGYIEDDGLAFWAPGLTAAEALNNADSYGWFCFAAYFL